MTQKITMNELLPFIEDAFSKGEPFKMPMITGTSMLPLLVTGRDTVTLKKVTEPLKIGDLPLYKRGDGAFVLHRIVGIDENGYIMCGDNQSQKEFGIKESQIIAVTSEITRKGKTFSVQDEKYLRYVSFWLKLLKIKYGRALGQLITQGKINRSTSSKSKENPVSSAQASQANVENIIKAGENLIKIISGIVNNKTVDSTTFDFARIFKLSEAHRITGFVAYGAEHYEFDEKIKNAFTQTLFKTAARFTAQEREIKEVSKLFSSEKIEHCFLKGHKISELYDVPESRFMLDIDIFVGADGFEKAVELLKNRGYEVISTEEKDCSLSKKPFLNMDLHRELKYDYDLGYDFYKNVSDRLIKTGYEKTMTNEEFYTYLLSHTAHHFTSGGTGIKSVIDHYYILKNLVPRCDEEKLEEYLKMSGLFDFNEQFTALTNAWLSGGEHTEITKEMGEYIILSGAYGTDVNYYVNKVLRGNVGDTKKGYVLTRLFPKYDYMCHRFPVLKKYKLLLPLFYIIRIFMTLFSAERISGEAKGISGVKEEQKLKQSEFLKNVGL